MILSKEECLEALGYLEKLEQEKDCCDEKTTVLNQLIFEHFENPPLKFEELEENKDYYHFEYGWIRILNIQDRDLMIIVSLGCPGYFCMEFEENSFYRKQVEE